jgi:ADP-heptose:LPS heptosyltransferase
MVRKAMAPLARMVRGIDEVLVPGPTVGGMEQAFRKFRPDLMISLSRSSKVAWAAWRAEVPGRIGTGFRLYSRLFTARVEEHRRNSGIHEVDFALSFAHRAGAISAPARFPLAVPRPAMEGLDNWLELQRIREPFVVIHPGAGQACVSWPPVHFVQLATLLVAEEIQVVFSMGENDLRFIQELEDDHLCLRRLPRFQGNLESRAALFARSTVAVGNGSGGLHLASALGVPVLMMHPPWKRCGYQRRGPYASNGWALVAESDKAAGWSSRRRQALGTKLMASITPADARRCVVAMMEGREPEL